MPLDIENAKQSDMPDPPASDPADDVPQAREAADPIAVQRLKFATAVERAEQACSSADTLFAADDVENAVALALIATARTNEALRALYKLIEMEESTR